MQVFILLDAVQLISAMLRQTAVTAYLESKQLLLFAFACQISSVITNLEELGGSYCITHVTSGMSTPRPITSVQISTPLKREEYR